MAGTCTHGTAKSDVKVLVSRDGTLTRDALLVGSDVTRGRQDGVQWLHAHGDPHGVLDAPCRPDADLESLPH